VNTSSALCEFPNHCAEKSIMATSSDASIREQNVYVLRYEQIHQVEGKRAHYRYNIELLQA
jgi:hypothetical protein